MKTLRLIGMALLAVILSVGFTACSDDDDSGQQGNGNNGLKLSSYTFIEHEDGDGGYYGYEFEYDEQGRVSKAVYSDEDYSDRTTVEYNGNSIIATNSDGHKDVCTLNSKGQIENSVCTSYGYTSTYQYTYDGNGYLTNIYRVEEDDDYRFTWENGNLVKAEMYGTITTIEYTDIPSSKGGQALFFLNDVTLDIDCDILHILGNFGYMGKVPQNMPASMTYTDKYGDTDLTEFSYETGKDGYISNINFKMNGNSVYDMTLSWE